MAEIGNSSLYSLQFGSGRLHGLSQPVPSDVLCQRCRKVVFMPFGGLLLPSVSNTNTFPDVPLKPNLNSSFVLLCKNITR
jgi:hypothetical protein